MKNILQETFGEEKRWVVWKLEKREGDPKPTKKPYQINGNMAQANNPDTWSTYQEVKDALEDPWFNFTGIGIQFGLGSMFLGIDLDRWLVNGVVVPEKKYFLEALIEVANTYVEVSPSKEGLHLFLKLSSPLTLLANKKQDKDGTAAECYTDRRFFTVTEIPFGEPKPIRTVTPEEASKILSIIGYPWVVSTLKDKPLTGAPASSQGVLNMDDSEVMRRMFASKSGQAISSLWVGDTSHYNNDTSAADLALCSYLAFWTAKDSEAMERLWLASVLGQRQKTVDRKDYRDRTILTAINNCTETFKGGSQLIVDSKPSTINNAEDEAPVVLISEAAKTLPDLNPVSTGFDVFDIAMSGGFRAGDLVILTGNTGMGKTSFAQTITYNVSKSQVHSVWFSYEMILSEVWKKFKAMGVDEKFLAYTPFKMVSGSTDWISQKIIEAKKKFGVKAVFIDHLGFLAPGAKKYDSMMANNYSAFLGNISRQLKLFALEYDVTIFLIAHTRKSEDPTINDIGNSVAVAQEADSVFIVHREADKYGGEVLSPYTKITLAKNRRTGITKKVSCVLVNGKLEITTDEVRPAVQKKAYPVLSHEVDHGPNDFDYI